MLAKSMDEGKEVARGLRGWMDGGQEFIGGQQVEWGEGFTETERLIEAQRLHGGQEFLREKYVKTKNKENERNTYLQEKKNK